VPAETVSSAEPPGVYGKLPARGDFVTRRFCRQFVEAWDEWLSQAIFASREALRERWVDIYLTSPIWRFAIGGGICGPNTVLGVLAPSVDKVGRHFPLTLGCELAPDIELTALIARAAPWYRAVEELALAALVPEFDLGRFDQGIALDIETVSVPPEATEVLAEPGLYVPLGRDARGAELRQAHQPLARGRSLWWTSGSERVTSCLLICAGMPSSRSFTTLLDGAWARGGWLGPAVETVPVADKAASESPIDPPLAGSDEALADEATAISRDDGGAVTEAPETPLPAITPLPRDEKDGPTDVAE
jgi:type VI secretion system protein ImpM